MIRSEIINWLKETDSTTLEELWQRADEIRKENVGDEVHLRGLIEISSHCARLCGYCGLNARNKDLKRYRMSAEEIVSCAKDAVKYGYGTAVIQAGEDFGITKDWVVDLIRKIKDETPLAVTLSLGERSEDELIAWRRAGADRYLLRFETSSRQLYEIIHPPLAGKYSDRFEILRNLGQIGYEVGSGVMIGIPGQSYEVLADDLEQFKAIDLDMIGVGPFITHPDTPLGRGENIKSLPEDQQVPNTELMTYKVVALTRIICPQTNIPSTSALATLNIAEGRELGLNRGANIIMPNLTPVQYRALYEIYPAKACVNETAEQCHGCVKNRILAIGRTLGSGRGDSPRYRHSIGDDE